MLESTDSMAPQVLIDFSNIGEQIITAVKSSFENFKEEAVAKSTASATGKGQENEFDIRAQILGKDYITARSALADELQQMQPRCGQP